MASNFSFLEKNPQYNSFSGACSEAERSIAVSPATTAILVRRALELAVKWLYSYDRDLNAALVYAAERVAEERVFPVSRSEVGS